ncbi:unnamed protein product [Leptosia nina]|uniref:Uncharacterized protein n=1 Tax=Leptosia nina TaxID=320188 RepID=A0AAV1J933_9NEOP
MPKPTVAQQLCHDIVEPALKASANNVKSHLSRKSIIKAASSRSETKPSRSVYIEKKSVTKKIAPTESSKSRVNTLKSSGTVLRKKFIDSAINTLISGPLRCDNYCVTMVRKRDQNPCKCGSKKVIPKAISHKVIQTPSRKNFSKMDKACANRFDAVTCGTQFYDSHSSKLKSAINKSRSRTNIYFKAPYEKALESNNEINRSNRILNQENKLDRYNDRFESTSYFGGKRWALSDFPIRGPDF